MRRVPIGSPPNERGGRLRGAIDLVSGRYPGFLFGLPVGDTLPVFHFHQTTMAELEPTFEYLRRNDYHTVVSDDVARLVRDGRRPRPRSVMLAFDDAWASLWLAVGPLLERYDMRAVTYAIPARIRDAVATRPPAPAAGGDPEAADRAEDPFVTWPELRALSASGRVDVQSHTWSHSMIFSGSKLLGFTARDAALEPVLVHPRANADAPAEFISPLRLGYPRLPRRSRMSDALRFWPDQADCARAERFVAERGGAAFFAQPAWREQIRPVLNRVQGRWETRQEQVAAIEDELVRAREELEARLKTPVRHVCLPWGISGTVTRASLERLGVVSAFANRIPGRLTVTAGDDPYFLKRLHHRHIFRLPGTGRRIFTTLA